MDVSLPTQIDLTIVTPERPVVHESVLAVSIPGKGGYLGILPGHAPLLSELKAGELSYTVHNADHYVAVSWGFAEVLPDRVTILASLAERAEDIDIARAEEAKRRAEARLVQAKDIDYERARTALIKSLARLQVASRSQFAGRVGRQRMPPPQA